MNNQNLHNREAGAALPFAQAVITGGLLGLIVGVFCVWIRARDWWIYALLAWLIVTAVTWLILQRNWFTLVRAELLTGWDLNNDGIIGEPEPAPRHSVTVDIRQTQPGGYTRTDTARLPFSEADMQTLAAGLLAGRPFTEREFTGAGKPLSINQFRQARAEMARRGLIELTNPKAPQQGYRLTRAGRAVMLHFAPTAPTEGL